MKIKKILAFCQEFGIDPDTELDFYPGGNREIYMFFPVDKVPVPDRDTEEFDNFCDKWWYVTFEYDSPAFNVFY